MKALKNELIKELMELERKAEIGEDISGDKVYRTAKTLVYLEKACEIIHRENKLPATQPGATIY